MEIVKTLHVKFFPFGSVEPVGSVTVKDSPGLSHFTFKTNVGNRWIRHSAALKLNDEFLGFDSKSIEDSNSESFYVGSACFRHEFQISNALSLNYP